MHYIFELFVGRFLEEYFAADPTYSIDIKPQIYLDVAQREEGQPDIVLNKNGRPHLILDTKYKLFGEKPIRDDLNQMFMYCHTMGVRRAVLIYSDARAFHYEGQFKGMSLSARPLALDGDLATFRERCRVFAEGFAKEIATDV